MTIDNALKLASKELQNFERPRLEAEILLSFFLGVERVYLHLNSNQELESFDEFWELILRRKSYEPIEYITKRVSFYSEEFFIQKGALIPRPESEILIDQASRLIEKLGIKSVVEIGVGSGAVSIILAKKHPKLKITATDISKDALKVAQKNIALHSMERRVTLKHCSLADEVEGEIEFIVSNPPYIAKDAKLEPNVVEFEPEEALFAEDNGTKILKAVVETALKRGAKGVVCEMGFDQKEQMEQFFNSLSLKNYGFYSDLAGLDRGFWLIA